MKTLNFIKAIPVFIFLAFFANGVNAQLVNCNVFLQGNYVEVGININGAFGSSQNAPSGYHPNSDGVTMQNTCSSTCSTGDSALGFVADPAKDGWTVGTPAYFGDYFLPGIPQEGWSIEVNGVQSNAWNAYNSCGATSLFSGTLSGNNVSYSSIGSKRSGTWQGENGDSIAITQVTVVDTANVFFTMYITLKNNGTVTKKNVYYQRTVDPDNEVTVGGSFATINTVAYQLPNTLNATLVTAVGETYGELLGSGTLDCRAKCYYMNSTSTLSLEPEHNCDTIYAGTATDVDYSGTYTADVGIGLVFSLGNIAPGDSVTFAYAYVLSAADLTKAFASTDPQWTATTDTASIEASKDTAKVCASSLITVNISNPGSYTWNWTALTGETLTSYSGPATSVNTTTSVIALRAIGTDGCTGLFDTLYVYLNPDRPLPANPTATNSSPLCAGNNLAFTSSSSTTGATYSWSGPSSYSSTEQDPTISAATTAASGVYTVYAYLNGCHSHYPALTTATVNPAPSPIYPDTLSICSGSLTDLTEVTTGGSWSTSNSHASVAPGSIITEGLVAATAGVDTIYYTLGSCQTSMTVTVDPAPAPISPPGATLCVGNSTAFSESVGGGVWSASNGNATLSGSTVIAVSAGVDTISYSTGIYCTATATVTVNNAPTAISPSTASLCVGNSTGFTDATSGGTWSSSNGHATVSGSTVTGVSAGVDTIYYSIGTCTTMAIVTVVTTPAAISPTSTIVCTGHTVTLSETTGSGTWSASNSNATVSGGIVSGLSTGVDTITYAIGSCTATARVTVNATPSPISPSSSTVCTGSLTSLTDPTGAGSWSASNGHASVTGGSVSGASQGVDTILYTVSGCSTMAPVTVNITPTNISPSTASVCAGNSVTLTDGTSGGAWSSSNSHASVVGGTVMGLTSGVDTISYTIGTCTVMAIVTVNASPAAISPSGPVSVCLGSTTTLTDPSGSTTWSSGAVGTATVGAGTGVVSGIGIGVATISFTNSSGCSTLKTVTVVSNPAAISPASSALCIASTVSLTDATGGGEWSISNGHATIGAASSMPLTVTGASSGVDTVTYTIGSCFVTATVTVNPAPSAISPSGGVGICVAATASLTDGTSGGTWSSGATGVATVGTSGTVTGVSAGTATISYTNSYGCSAIKIITVNITPTAISPASATVCTGLTTTLTDGVGSGTWTSSSTNATVTGGVVTGVTVGTATITYTIGSCYVTAPVTVNLTPSIGAISGTMSECVGSSMGLSDTPPTGTWSSSNLSVATIGSSSGSVLGISGGTSIINYSINSSCGIISATATVTINAIPTGGTISGPTSVCSGTVNNYTDGETGGIWSTTNSDASITGGGSLTAITPGTDTIKYTVSNTCGTATATKVITIGSFLTAGSITGANSVCQGAHIPLTDMAPSGTWSSSNNTVATVGTSGIVTGIAGGVDTISYTVTASCGNAIATHTVTVNPLANAGTITGPSALCVGMSNTYTDTATGGVWSITNAHATITGGGSVTAATVGTDTIKYTVSNGCGPESATKTLTIGAGITAGSITGAGFVCAGASTPLTDAATGGVWSSSNGDATVGVSGLVTGVAAGLDTISYTVTASCGTAVATHTVLVNPLPNAGSITGPSAICTGATTTYTESTTGGTWSMSNAIATITGGVVNPLTSGIDTIQYTVINSCGTAVATLPVTIGSSLSTGSLTGPGVVCIGSSITLAASGGSGGTWSSSNGNATVTGGVVTGVATGTDVIAYTVSGSCGTSIATATVSVSAAPDAGSISGPSAICTGTTTTYTDGATGGTWGISNSNAIITGGGAVTALTAGMDTISYTATTGCGTATATLPISIGAFLTASSISGAGDICTGSTIPLTDGTTGGTWSTSNTHASVSGSGMVTGITAGTDTISYTVSSSCGTAVATSTVTVSAVPVSGSITGPAGICTSTFTLYTDTAAGTSGTWSISNADATITGGGLVTAITTGIDTITYTTTNACGTASASKIISITPSTGVGSITGPGVVCIGSSVALTDGVGGGTWSSSNGTATVTSSGMVTGITTGMDTIAYTIAASCGAMVATHVMSISLSGTAGSITGASAVCVGSLITLTDPVTGGDWSSSNASATITTGGVVTGITPGTDTISYTVISSCGIAAATKIITIGALTSGTGSISGPGAVCVGSTITLTDATTGGSWSTSSTHATVGSTGIVTGITEGTAVISYSVTSGCGAVVSTSTISIDTLPDPGTITGGDSVCLSGTLALTDATGGGTWSSGSANATVTGGGMVTGISGGTASIFYTVTNSCGTASATEVVVIVTTPATSGTIVGGSEVCVGAGLSLTDAVPDGGWYTSNGNAVVTGPGLIDGVSVGIDTVFYIVSNVCGTSEASKILAVNPAPAVAFISGSTSQCTSTVISLSDGTTGGTWTSSNPTIAIVGASTGNVTGLSAGVATITYSVTNVYGCATNMTSPDTVEAIPASAPISGSINVCIGSSAALSDATPGGTWSSGATAVATIDASGNVTGISAGLATITYSVVNLCGTEYVTRTETVSSPPTVAAITGTTHQCAGASTTLGDATTGGAWSSSNTAIATVGSVSGLVNGVGVGTATINYTYTGPSGCSLTIGTQDTVVTAPTVAAITGITNECIGGTNLLSNSTPGGTWSSSAPSVATIAGSGLVTGVSPGVTMMSYSVSNLLGCTTTVTTGDTVNTIPVPAAISGTLHVCDGATTTLTNPISGGVWSSGSPAIATVSSSTGVVTGAAAGTAEIYYSISNSCGAAFDSARMTVNAAPTVSAITAIYTNLCSGTSAHLSETATGGIWSSSDATIASVTSAGIVTGNTAGSATISYTVTNSSGCEGSATIAITVGIAMASATVSPAGSATLCHGHTVYMYVVTSGTGLTYQWLRNGGTITGATNLAYTTGTAGNYSVVVSNGICSETITGTNVVAQPNPVISFTAPDVLHTGSFASYQWLFNGVAIPGAITSTYDATAAGVYKVVVMDGNGCTDTSTAYTISNPGTNGVNNVVVAADIKVYPNPATATLHIDAPVNVNVTILSVDGKELITQKNATSIDISNLANGMYLVMIYDGNGILIKTAKFAKLNP